VWLTTNRLAAVFVLVHLQYPVYPQPGTSAIAGFYVPGDDMDENELKAEIERLRSENEKLKTSGPRELTMKVSEKGAVSVYGLGRFPVTLYKEQWKKVLGMASEIEEFIQANDHLLKAKE